MLPLRTNNPMAPAAFNGLSSITPEWEDKDFSKWAQFTLTASQVLTNQAIPLDKDADFIWQGIQIVGVPAKPFAIRFSDSSGYYLSDVNIGSFAYQASFSGVGCPFVLPVPLLMPAGSAVVIDLIEQSGTTNGPIQMLLRGQKRFYR